MLAFPGFHGARSASDLPASCAPASPCYTRTVTTRNTGSECHPLTTCGIIAECILETTQYVTVPSSNACCATTPTTSVPGPCPTCQTGCATDTITVVVTASRSSVSPSSSAPTPTPAPTSSSVSCPRTVFFYSATEGPTRTIYAATSTKTVLENCGGCTSLVARNILGVGPVVIFNATVTEKKATTVTQYACSLTPY